MKKTLTVIIGILAIVLILSFAKDAIVKVSAESAVRFVTGLKLSVDSFKVGVLRTIIDIKNLVLFNPAGYQDKTMCKMPEIYVKYDLPSIIKGTMHIPDMRINLSEFMVVKNEKGELNLNALNVVKEQKQAQKPSEKAKAPQIKIDSLELKIGKVIYKDYSQGGAPKIQEFNVNINEKYKDITNIQALASLIIVKAMMNTTIASLANFDLQGLKGTVTDTLKSAEKIATQVTQQAQQVMKQTLQMTGGAAKGAEDVTKKTADTLKQVLTLPFGAKQEEQSK